MHRLRYRQRANRLLSGMPSFHVPATTVDFLRVDATIDVPLLEVRELSKGFTHREGFLWQRNRVIHALEGIDLNIQPGQSLGVVGEAGSGKTTLARCVSGSLVPTHGQVYIDGEDIAGRNRHGFRGKLPYVFKLPQDNRRYLKSDLPVQAQVAEALAVQRLRGPAAAKVVVELVEMVGLQRTDLTRSPREISSGGLQRTALACILARSYPHYPRLLVLDEPTTDLDRAAQASFTNLLNELRIQHHLTYLVLTRDWTTARSLSDWIAILYSGRVIEIGLKAAIERNPRHPYTQALISSMADFAPPQEVRNPLYSNSLATRPRGSGCIYYRDCPKAYGVCSKVEPQLEELGAGHRVACLLVN